MYGLNGSAAGQGSGSRLSNNGLAAKKCDMKVPPDKTR